MSEQRLCQHHAHLLVVRQFAHHLVVLWLFHAQVLQQLGSLTLGLPSVHLGEGHLQFGGFHTVFFSHLRLGIQRLAVFHVLPQRLVALHHGIHHRELIELEVVLAQHRQAFARSQFHASLVRFQFSADGFQQSRFAGTIGTDDAIDVAVGELHVNVFVEHALAKLNGQIC